MDVIETLLKLPESERQKLAEALLLLKNVGTNSSSNDSADKSSRDLKDSLNLSNNAPDKPVSKQKTLDNWIVKNKTPPTNCEKEVNNSKKPFPIDETDEASRNFNSEEFSSALGDQQLPCSSSSPSLKSKSNTVIKKKLMVLLDKQACFESKHSSPDHSDFSLEKELISPVEINSPWKKYGNVSENSDKKTFFLEKHSPTLPRSYNLRSARGVSDEKPSSETNNSLVITTERENGNKIPRLVTKQKPKFKNSVGKDASIISSTCLKEVNDQKTDSYNEIISEGNTKSSECKILSTVVNSELERTIKVISVDSETLSDENPIPVESGRTLVVKGKRKKAHKNKESKKSCVAITALKSSTEDIKMNSSSTQSIPSKKVMKSNVMNENLLDSSIEKMAQLPESALPKQKSKNGTVKSVSKLKSKKTTKRMYSNELTVHEEKNLDSRAIKVKKKTLLNARVNSDISKHVLFQNEISDKQLKSAATYESQSKESGEVNSVTSVNVNSKKIRKRGRENKSMKASKNNLMLDSEMAIKFNDEDCTEISSETFPLKNKESVKEFKEILAKDINSGTVVNTNSTRMSRKRESENKSILAAKKYLLSNSEPASKNYDKDIITSIETSFNIIPTQNNEFDKEEIEALKDSNTVPTNVTSKKKLKKTNSGNKSTVVAENSLSNSRLASKNDNNGVTSTENLSVDSSKNSTRSMECSKEADELIKVTNTETSVNVGSKRANRKRGIRNESTVTTKNHLISDSDQASKTSDTDSFPCNETLSNDSKNTPPFVAKELSAQQTSSINKSSAEKYTLSINQSKCSKSIILHSHSGDHSRKNSQNSSNDELDSLIKMKESPENQSQNPSVVSSNVPKSNNDILHSQGNSNSSAVSKKMKAFKKKNSVRVNSRKKSKATKNENQSNTTQRISDNLDCEMENTALNIKKSSLKKKISPLKLKADRDSNEEHLDVLIIESTVSSPNSSVLEESKDQFKNLTLNDKFAQGRKEKMRIKNSKKVKKSHFKKKNHSSESQVSSINLSKNDKVEKLNCNLVGDSSVKNKVCKTKINKKDPIKSTNKEKSIIKAEYCNLSEKPTEKEYLSKKISEVQMELDSYHSVEKSETSDNITSLYNSVDAEKAKKNFPDISVDIISSSESGKEKNHIIETIGRNAEKADLAVNNSNDTGVVQTDFKNSDEFDEKMKNNYLAFCKMKEVLEAIGISIEEVFENPEMINCLNSVPPDGAIKISTCKSNSKILFTCINHKRK